MKNRFYAVYAVISAISLLAADVQAANTFTIKNGASNWNSPDSYSSGPGGVPTKGDVVEVPASASVWIRSSDKASCDMTGPGHVDDVYVSAMAAFVSFPREYRFPSGDAYGISKQ